MQTLILALQCTAPHPFFYVLRRYDHADTTHHVIAPSSKHDALTHWGLANPVANTAHSSHVARGRAGPRPTAGQPPTLALPPSSEDTHIQIPATPKLNPNLRRCRADKLNGVEELRKKKKGERRVRAAC